MSDSSLGVARAKIVSPISPASDEEILDWEVPSIQLVAASDTIRVLVRDAEPEPILDI